MGNFTRSNLRINCLLFLFPALGLAGTWTGVLVDSKCYDTAARNVNPWEPYHDQSYDVRLCRPTGRTKVFAIVQGDWTRLKLDPSANTQAAEVVRNSDKKKHYWGVVITGEKDKDTLKVETIAAAKSQ